MEKTVKKILTAAISIVLMLACVLLVTACSGVKVTPGGDGSVVITPDNNNSGGSDNNDNTNNGSQNSGEIHTHTFVANELSVDNNSCTVGGVKIWSCACGASFSENIAAQGHDIRYFEGKAATCTEDGYKPYEKCIRGNCTYTTFEKIPALDHVLKYYLDVQPTCMEDGVYDRAECQREGCNYKNGKIIAALGHQLQMVEGKAATCTEDGYYSYEICTRAGCDGQGILEPVKIYALGHDDVHHEAKDPTCTEFGWDEYDVCQRCGRSTYEKKSENGHNYINGYCACGKENLALHTHIWDEGIVSKDATCTSAGVIKYTCTDENCGDTKNEEIAALGHDNRSVAGKSPTCISDGWRAYEECERCGYSTYAVESALGHSYNNGVVTVAPTCTSSGVRTYSCVRDNCTKTISEEISKLGHDWGSWFVSVEVTCTSSGKEQRICFNDSTHVDNRTITKLGHDWSEYNIVKNPTCTEEGQKKRTCNNDTSHEEIAIIPLDSHDVVLSTGICNKCKNVINQPLDTPVITSFNNYVIFWNAVDGADHYEVRVIWNGQDETFKVTNSLNFSLEDKFKECNSLDVYLRAMSPEGSTTPHSDYFQENYSVAEGSIVNYEGVGKTVNLLTDSYTNYGTGTKSIFNQYLFNRLMAGDEVTVNDGYGNNVYTESISEYVNKRTTNIGGKISKSLFAGFDKVLKATGGFNFEIDGSYAKKTYNQTKTVFYDAYYIYQGYQGGIEGFSDPKVLYTILSDEFIIDAGYLQNGEMTPEAFINKYGTHVITAGIYGAKFNAHYEMLASKKTLEVNNKVVTRASITAGIEAIIEGIPVGGSNGPSASLTIEDFVSSTNSDMRTVFEFSAVGGSHIDPAMSLSDFKGVSQKWYESIKSEDDYVLIDVPDGSLYFVWDFLGDEYADVKEALNDYFYACCDEQYDALNNKINGMYKDFFNFDYETGTLTFDLSALQEPETDTTSLKDVLYMDGNAEIFNGATGKFTIYSKFNGHDVKKIVFEGAYNTRESQHNALIDAYFDGIYIVFNESWTNDRDIIVEFKNFAYHAPAGYSALDFSEVSSENITVIATGYNELVGGDGSAEGADGNIGINAPEKNLVINGDGEITITAGAGGKGAKGTTPSKNGTGNGGKGKTGAAGGIGIVANTVKFSSNVVVIVNGGTGGRGGHGGNSVNEYWGSENSGGKGGTGGVGGVAISAANIYVENTAVVSARGGNGGNGGNGGYRDTRYSNGSKGAGGTGGSGAEALYENTVISGNLVSEAGDVGAAGSTGGSWYSPDDYDNSKYWKN